jgi:hypothetical protein
VYAPARAGRAVAPWRNATNAAINTGSDNRGIAIRQIFELNPIIRTIHGERCGNIISRDSKREQPERNQE